MLRALVESVPRFPHLPPDGYREADIRWVLEVNPAGTGANMIGYGRGELTKMVPATVRTSGVKSSLLADKAAYALGLTDKATLEADSDEHRAFRTLLEGLRVECEDPEVDRILDFLGRLHTSDEVGVSGLRTQITTSVKPGDMVALRASALEFPFEHATARAFWLRRLEAEH